MIRKNQKSKIKNQIEGRVQRAKRSAPTVKERAVVPEISAAKSVEPRSVTVKGRYLRISFQKLNLVAKTVRRRSLLEAENILAFSKTKAGRMIGSLLKSAKAAAEARGLKPNRLYLSELLTQQGPSLKRGQAVARGSFHPIRKKTAHLILRLQENYGSEN